MIKSPFLFLGIVLILTACHRKEQLISAENAAITKTINDMYYQYGKSNEAVYRKPISDTAFSPDLKKKLEHAINISKDDIEKVKKSDHPDEKPLIFEGAIFSSLYEGYTGYTIQSIAIHDQKAKVSLRFKYNKSYPEVTWTDTIHLIHSGNYWKIDNITFAPVGSSKDLKTRLTDFVQNTP
ncbi:hypothetical protein [Chryseobacterium sp.]|uniref:hypothetical protein n=1 Tax=Chryseobacterium sp. TaxID=1871047 RepID=UPI0025C00C47|nr:hypothetical protein [Chryseobacterium sp.]MBV8327573.1 hypothetical protein [Chryseobacterium sp.]